MQWSDSQIREQVEACLGDDPSLFIVEVLMNTRRGGHQLIVRCEADNGITVDQLTRLNRSINSDFELPGLDLTTLSVEVTSPGPSFLVKSVRHFKRHIGHTMKVKHHHETHATPLRGEITAVSDGGIQIKVEDELIDLSYDLIDEAKAQFQW